MSWWFVKSDAEGKKSVISFGNPYAIAILLGMAIVITLSLLTRLLSK